MKLLRFAVLNCNPKPNLWETFGLKRSDVTVGMIGVPGPPSATGELLLVLQAEMSLSGLPPRDSEGYITIPDVSRRSCEAAIEFVSNLIAVTGRCKRSISSPAPPAALVAEGPAEQQFLAESTGLRLAPISQQGAKPNITINEDLIAALGDRLEGLSLMAEAISHSQAMGEYRDLVRVFELAFSLPVTQLEKKLATFLAGACHGYHRSEIAKWVSLRNPASHANKQKSKFIVLEADVRPIILRMEQAAMDVLFNKKDWHQKSTDRRELLRPNLATTSEAGNFRLVRGQDAQFIIQCFDENWCVPLLHEKHPNSAARMVVETADAFFEQRHGRSDRLKRNRNPGMDNPIAPGKGNRVESRGGAVV